MKVLLNEKWKRAVAGGQQLMFEVSNYGRVRNFFSNKFIHGYFRSGYLRVKDTHIKKHFSIHRLVLEAFRPDDPNFGQDVHHINHCKTDNRLDNLEWIAHKDHSKESSIYRNENGKNNPNKYTHKQIKAVCSLLQSGELTCPQISRCTGVHLSTVYGILYEKMWLSISKDYDFSTHRKALKRTKETLDEIEKCILQKMGIKDIIKRFINTDGLNEKQIRTLYRNIVHQLIEEGKLKKDSVRPTKYSDKQVEEACKCIANGMTLPAASEKTKIPANMLYSIVNGYSRRDISSKYDFSNRGVVETKLSKYIPMVKSMIEAEMPYGQISSTLVLRSEKRLTEKQIKHLYDLVKRMKS